MPHLLRVSRKGCEGSSDGVIREGFPFALPAIRTLAVLDFATPVTCFVGENGSGKSTLLEAIAIAAELPSLGADQVAFDDTLVQQRALASSLRLSWTHRSRRGFFLRAEDFFGYLKRQARDDARIARERRESLVQVHATSEDPGPGARHVDERAAVKYLKQYDARSHGESFMELFSTRLRPGGLYLLDEPEAPLSPKRQIVLLGVLEDAARAGAQFVIATHSPILLGYPGARIYSFDNVPVAEVAYSDIEHVTVMREFLTDPTHYPVSTATR